LLGFTWFYSSESGFFNGLRRFQIRFSPSAHTCALQVVVKPFIRIPPLHFSSPTPQRRGLGSATGKTLAYISVFEKHLRIFLSTTALNSHARLKAFCAMPHDA
jgi:hypothetical protein